jgi:hypothetical protein
MTTTVLEREAVATTAGMGGVVVSEPSLQSPPVASPSLLRPPTLFGQRSSWELVERGYALACRAVGYALEAVKVPEAVDALIAEGDRDALEMAHDYLAYTHFTAPRSEQVAALFLIEDALYKLDQPQRRPIRTIVEIGIERAHASLRDWLHRIRHRRPHTV